MPSLDALSSERAALQESSVSGLSFKFAVFNDDLAAHKHGFGNTFDFTTLVSAVIHSHVMCFGADGVFPTGVENDDIGIGAYGDCPFLRKEAENLRRRRRGQFNEAVEADSLLGNAAIIDEAHPILDAGPAVRNLAEV